ncbi:hypothetical protein AVEN_159578-1 [Araneus ventricosus]|uniref:Uncharacterized protein n=1 Tax=Araneus ventricosus TaxID=182803 RepID=A0A4Y2HFX7_ARAVE|nr:hypothetical protein AVEN_159578-1 [Araneus ventricosus]
MSTQLSSLYDEAKKKNACGGRMYEKVEGRKSPLVLEQVHAACTTGDSHLDVLLGGVCHRWLTPLYPLGSYYFCFVQSQFFPMLKRKEEELQDASSRRRQLENVKGELLKLKKKEAADRQLWHNARGQKSEKKQKNKVIADCQTWHNVEGEKSRRNRRTKK